MLSRNLRKYKVICFDCTNTLLFFKRDPSEVYLHAAIETGHGRENFDQKIIATGFRKHFKEMSKNHPNFGCESIGYVSWWTNVVQNVLHEASHGKIHREEFTGVADKLINLYTTDEVWGKFARSNELIKAMKKDGKIVGVISNFDPRLPLLLRRMGFIDFDFFITSYEAKCEKPDRKIFEHALEKATALKLQLLFPNEALHIGNEIDKDHEGATEAGWSSVLINSKSTDDKVPDAPCFKDIEDFWVKLNYEELKL